MISFIVPAHDEEQFLGRTLDAVDDAARALGQPFEVVVVDDASTDRTACIAREHGARVVPVTHRQIAATRNAGAREAKGELLVFVDADTVVTEAAVRAAVEAMLRGAVGGGCAFEFDGRLPLYGRVLAAVAIPLYRACGLASGCFLFCTRDAFRAAGGFDEGLFAGEEAALSRALRRRGRFVVLRESVTTSGRKLRAHSGREILGLLARLAFTGPKSVRRREGLDVWYGKRRADPDMPDMDGATMGAGEMIRLEAASPNPPRGLRELLADLGPGESGFSGTPVHTGEATLEEYLVQCCDMSDPGKVPPGLVPQTVFWALDEEGEAVGMVRLRHRLNDSLRLRGGHCGYFVRSDRRGKGYATAMLRLALAELRRLGEPRALLTTTPDNLASIRVIEANGGQFDGMSVAPETGTTFNRYWIDLTPQ